MKNNIKKEQNGELSALEKEFIKQFVEDHYTFGRGNTLKGKLEDKDSEELKESKNYLVATFVLLFLDYKKRMGGNADVKDAIKYLNQGFFSSAFLVGDNVIKLGLSSYEGIELGVDSPAALKVFYQKKIKLIDTLYCSITILPYVQTKTFGEEDVYQVFKGLRDSGYLWNDPTPENIGILQENHTSNFEGISYDSLKVGQKPGDLVALDLDDMCDLKKFTPDELHWITDDVEFGAYNHNVYRFEQRYEKETKTCIRIL